MKISAVIPTFNSARVIGATLESVLRQSLPADEILVLDDGSTDETVSILNAFKPRVTVLEQKNRGVAAARNALSARAGGDLIAYLDHDDLWHPAYLKTQARLFKTHPEAVAFVTGHVNFNGYGGYEWPDNSAAGGSSAEVIEPLRFLERYTASPGPFASMSFCCLPKSVINQLGSEPFCVEISGVDDFYLFHTLMLLGSVVFDAEPLVAYRITQAAQSANLLKSVQKGVRALEMLEPRFNEHADQRLKKPFAEAAASQRREYGRLLMGAGQAEKARKQLLISMTHQCNLASRAKSLAWLLLTGIPSRFQPRWPAAMKASHVNQAAGK